MLMIDGRVVRSRSCVRGRPTCRRGRYVRWMRRHGGRLGSGRRWAGIARSGCLGIDGRIVGEDRLQIANEREKVRARWMPLRDVGRVALPCAVHVLVAWTDLHAARGSHEADGGLLGVVTHHEYLHGDVVLVRPELDRHRPHQRHQQIRVPVIAHCNTPHKPHQP